ncbi:MAG: alpha/beta-hydrolase N-terminal domain-containing protein, partial [Paracoccaceae bacterium]
PIVQGVQSGLVFAVGYGLGRFGLSFWRFLELRELRGYDRRILALTLLAMAAGLAVFTLNRMVIWQNSIRDLMEMPLVESAYPVTVVAIAFATAAVLLLIALGLIWVGQNVSAQMNRIFPRRISIALGTVLVAAVVWQTGSGGGRRGSRTDGFRCTPGHFCNLGPIRPTG